MKIRMQPNVYRDVPTEPIKLSAGEIGTHSADLRRAAVWGG